MTKLLDGVLESLSALIAGDDDRKRLLWPKAKIQEFDGFDLMDPDAGREDVILMGSPSDLPVWPMNAIWCMKIDPAVNQYGLNGWGFKKVKTLNPRDWRGKLRIVVPRMVEHHEFFVEPSGATKSSVAPIALLKNSISIAGTKAAPGFGYCDVQAYDTDGREVHDEAEAFDISFASGVMLRREYLWSVLLGEPGIPRARFVTDILGVREAFRLRDAPPGKERRAALRHWVREHWRKNGRASENDRAWVRQHLRGASEFMWNGLACRVEPSMEDARKAAKKAAAGAHHAT